MGCAENARSRDEPNPLSLLQTRATPTCFFRRLKKCRRGWSKKLQAEKNTRSLFYLRRGNAVMGAVNLTLNSKYGCYPSHNQQFQSNYGQIEYFETITVQILNIHSLQEPPQVHQVRTQLLSSIRARPRQDHQRMDGGVLFFGNFLSLQRYGLASRLCYIAAAQLSKSFYNLVIRVDHSVT